MRKANHRSAFASDPKFMERIANQLKLDSGQPPHQPEATAQPSAPEKKPSKATLRLKKVQHANMDGRLDSMAFDAASGVLTVCFPGAKLVSLNIMLRVHDAKATSLKTTWFKRVECLRYLQKDVFEEWGRSARFPLVVEEVYITGEANLLDNESVAAACKPVIDAFVYNGFLPDDSPAYVAHPLPYTSRGTAPGLVICFRPTVRAWGLIEDSTIQVATSLPG